MALKLDTRFEVHFAGRTMVIPKGKVEHIDGQPFFKLACAHFPTIKLLTGVSSAECKNPSIAYADGILAVKTARNVASGLTHQASALEAAMMSDGEAPARKKHRKINILDATVTFKVPHSYDLPSITCKRAVAVDEPIAVPVTEDSLQALFTTLTQIGINVSTKRSYIRSGRFAKGSSIDGDAEGDTEGEAEGDADGDADDDA
jgi:hypothetical protein